MKTLNYYTIIFVLLFLFCCSDKKTESYECDDELISNFQNCLTIISHYKFRSGVVNSDHFLRSVTCLYQVTGIQAHIYQGDVVGYTSDEDYFNDLKAWNKWFSKNSGSFSNNDAFLKFQEFSKENQMKLEWPPMFSDLLDESDK